MEDDLHQLMNQANNLNEEWFSKIEGWRREVAQQSTQPPHSTNDKKQPWEWTMAEFEKWNDGKSPQPISQGDQDYDTEALRIYHREVKRPQGALAVAADVQQKATQARKRDRFHRDSDIDPDNPGIGVANQQFNRKLQKGG